MNLFDSIIAGKFGGGSGGGGVSSWNDLTDKPFYTEGGIVEILPETEVECDPENSTGYIFGAISGVEADKTYTVKCNGVDYETVAMEVAQEGMTGVLLGNSGALMGGEGTGEPFVMIVLSPEMVDAMGGIGAMVMPLDGNLSFTVSIYHNAETIHKLDNKYIDAEWMATTKEVVGEEILAERKYISISTPVSNVDTSSFVAGKKVLVICDGTEYECVVTELSVGGEGGLVIGNIGAVTGSGWGSGVPFIFIIEGNEVTVGLPEAGSTLAVYAIEEIPNKIPEKFLPMYEGESEDA